MCFPTWDDAFGNCNAERTAFEQIAKQMSKAPASNRKALLDMAKNMCFDPKRIHAPDVEQKDPL
jgi:hypothetical protein